MAKVRKAVITAAGRGTRQYPASSAVQKEMFPLVDRDGVSKPVMQIIAEECVEAGVEEICIVTQPGQERHYREYFRRMSDRDRTAFEGKEWALLQSEKLGALGERLHFAEQRSPDGFGHAVYQARELVGDEPFLLLLGDHVYISNTDERCARQLIKVYETHSFDAVTGVQPTAERSLHLFGVIRGVPLDSDSGVFDAELIIEKPDLQTARERLVTPGLPADEFLAHFGMHVFSPRIFESLEFLIASNLRESDEIQLTTAQEHLRQRTRQYGCAAIDGQRYDTGIPLGLMETQIALAMHSIHRDEILQHLKKYFGAAQNIKPSEASL